ncbi:MAG: thioredoxin-like domain-containing protein, partial [Methanococcaceae archaeon]
PEFPEGLDWLNTDKPLKLADLHGKVVLLDFWTFCCINCMHIIPDLKKLEEKYADELVVIGVHSAKFLTEQGTDNIRQAILRYGIEHPVVNDKDFKIWRDYGANSWPTVVLIDPKGDVVGSRAGEGVFDTFDSSIQKIIDLNSQLIDRRRLTFDLEKNKRPESLLSFPGKVLADEKSGRLLITDSNHNRIIISDLEGNIRDIIGSGEAGQKDGTFEDAQFFHPQGTALDKDILYIADTENHLIRKADLKNRSLITIAGVGKQVYQRNPTGDAKKTGLNSPWDLVIHDGTLYIAMAGPHQIWAIDLSTNKIRLHAGSGSENILDGDLTAAALAQPSGITTDGKKLYFADSEVSAVRSADFNIAGGKVNTIIGHGLFEFGDVDGNADMARFQHPLGIDYVDGKLYLADTYNNKIKVVDPILKISKNFAGTGKEGMTDGDPAQAEFNEPGGISYAKGKFYIADTNNDLVRTVDARTGAVSTLMLKGIEKLRKSFSFDRKNFDGEIRQVDNFNINGLGRVTLKINLPDGYELNSLAPGELKVFTEDGKINLSTKVNSAISSVLAENKNFSGKLLAEALIYYCKEGNEGLCLIKDILFEFKNNENGKTGEALLEINISAK